VLRASPWQLPFGPCNQQHFQNQQGPERWMIVCLQVIVAKLPFLETRHLQLVGMIAADCICPSTVDLSRVQGGSRESILQ